MKGDLAARQALVALFLDDPTFEALVRADPGRAAAELGVPFESALQLAAIPSHRVRAFRASRSHKDSLRHKVPERGRSK